MAHGDIETLFNEGRWYNVIQGTDQVSEPFETKDEAIAEGREMARDADVEHRVKALDGQVEERIDFGEDGGDPGS